MLVAGDPAIDFDLAVSGPGVEGRLSLASLRGNIVILYFYPQDDTPGCTNEAQQFEEHRSSFDQVGVVVVGVSKDTVESHDRFRQKYRLGFPLVSDPDGDICVKYGAWREKNLYGRKVMGMVRCTFVIGPDGVVTKVWKSVKVDGHAQRVLSVVVGLRAEWGW